MLIRGVRLFSATKAAWHFKNYNGILNRHNQRFFSIASLLRQEEDDKGRKETETATEQRDQSEPANVKEPAVFEAAIKDSSDLASDSTSPPSSNGTSDQIQSLESQLADLLFEELMTAANKQFEQDIEDQAKQKEVAEQEQQAIEEDREKKGYEFSELYWRQKYHFKQSGHLGSNLKDIYEPYKDLQDSTAPSKSTVDILLAAGAHLGHSTSLWRSSTQGFVAGERDGIHIIDLDKTIAYLRRACRVVAGVAEKGGVILFLGNRDGQAPYIIKAANRCNGYYLTKRWIPGTISNSMFVLGDKQLQYVDMGDNPLDFVDGKLSANKKQDENESSNYSKELDNNESNTGESKAQALWRRTRMKLEEQAKPVRDAIKESEKEFKSRYNTRRTKKPVRPDLVVIFNPIENRPALNECARYRIPTIGVIDTDSEPSMVTYPIPANDDSLRTIALLAGMLSRAGEEGRQRRIIRFKAAQSQIGSSKSSGIKDFIVKGNPLAGPKEKLAAFATELAKDGQNNKYNDNL